MKAKLGKNERSTWFSKINIFKQILILVVIEKIFFMGKLLILLRKIFLEQGFI